MEKVHRRGLEACRVRSKMGDRGKEELVVEQKVGVALLTASFKPP